LDNLQLKVTEQVEVEDELVHVGDEKQDLGALWSNSSLGFILRP
jgi:hypothetical protein